MKMKTRFNAVKACAIPFFGLLMMITSSCLDQETVVPEYAYFSLYHASPDAEDVDVFLNQGKINTNDFAYGDYSNGYVFTSPGTHKLKLVDADNTSTTLMDTTISLTKNEYYSVFFTGLSDEMEVFVIKDVPSSTAAANDEAFVRFIHLAPDAPEVDVIADDQILFSDITYKENVAFRKLKVTDEFDLTVNSSTETATVLLSKNEIDLTPKRYYTIIFKGLTSSPPGSASALDVEIVKN